MPILIKEVREAKTRTKRYESWTHYKSTEGYSYPDPPTETLDNIKELEIAEVLCGYCWGQRVVYALAMNGEGYVRSDCPRCFATGVDFVLQ